MLSYFFTLLFIISTFWHTSCCAVVDAVPRLTYERVAYYSSPTGVSAVYRLTPINFPYDTSLILTIEMLDGTKDIIENLRLNPQGQLIKACETRPYLVARNNAILGEATRYTLMTKDGTKKAGITIVHLPIEAKDTQGRRISLELLSPDGSSFLLHGEGYTPLEQVQVISSSGKEVSRSTIKVSSDGRFVAMTTPPAKNQSSGEAIVQVIGKNSKLQLQYQWGRTAAQPYKG